MLTVCPVLSCLSARPCPPGSVSTAPHLIGCRRCCVGHVSAPVWPLLQLRPLAPHRRSCYSPPPSQVYLSVYLSICRSFPPSPLIVSLLLSFFLSFCFSSSAEHCNICNVIFDQYLQHLRTLCVVAKDAVSVSSLGRVAV